MQNLIACGCSWTLGTHSKFNDPLDNPEEIWSNLKNVSYSEQLPTDNISMWAQNGVSNYAIACQVSDAIDEKPDLIVFNTTTTSRYDIARPNRPQGKTWCKGETPWARDLTHITTQRFTNEYRSGPWPRPDRSDFFNHNTNSSGTIISKSLSQMKNYTEYSDLMGYLFGNYQPGFNSEDAQKVLELFTEYSDWGIKHHTDTMIINSIVRDLEQTDIPWICVDITGIAPVHDRVHKIDLAQMLSRYPLTDDPVHWNQSGHDDLAQELIEKYF